MIQAGHVQRLAGVQTYSLIKHIDARGWFTQAWTSDELARAGFRPGFLQQNIAGSKHGVLRGMHRQDQTKLVTVIAGRIFDAILNPETGEWAGYTLGEGDAVYIPPHYAHGYLVLSDSAIVQYFVDAPWDVKREEQFRWDGYGIDWPLAIEPIMSAKDR